MRFWAKKRRFPDPSRFDKLCTSIPKSWRTFARESEAEDSVTMFGQFAPKVKCTRTRRLLDRLPLWVYNGLRRLGSVPF